MPSLRAAKIRTLKTVICAIGVLAFLVTLRRSTYTVSSELATPSVSREFGVSQCTNLSHADAVVLLKKHLLPNVYAGPETQFERFVDNERNGFHLLPVHFYSPVPTLSRLPLAFFTRKSKMSGIDMNVKGQTQFLRDCEPFRNEFDHEFSQSQVSEYQYFWDNSNYRRGDGSVLHCMIRSMKPRRIVELGSGDTTKLMSHASVLNRREGTNTTVFVVDPANKVGTTKGLEAVISNTHVPAQALHSEALNSLLGDRGLLFVDTTHVATIGSDVTHILLELVPTVPKGTVIHFHDIFLPKHYPRAWVEDKLRFWNEQYMLQAFLVGNSAFEVLYACTWFSDSYPHLFQSTIYRGGGCFWIRKL